MASLTQLRESLSSLQSYTLPERFRTDGTTSSISPDRSLLDENVIQRYRNARDVYLRNRMTELFKEHMSTYDGVHNTVSLPPLPSAAEEEEVRSVQNKVKAEMSETVLKLKASFQNIHDNYALLCQRREELTQIIHDIEKDDKLKAVDDETMDDFETDDDVDENEMALVEEKLQLLIRKRSDLETKLRGMKFERQELVHQLKQKKEMVKEMLIARGASAEAASIGESEDCAKTVEQLEVETEELRQRSRHFREMAEYYDSVRGALEELGGIKILSVASLDAASSSEPTPNKSSQRRRFSSSPSPKSSVTQTDGIILKVLLFKKHVVKITLIHQDKPNTTDDDEILRVSSACFETSTTISNNSAPIAKSGHDNQSSRDFSGNVSIVIPPLDDLVQLSNKLDPGHDLRFLLREAMARIRSLTARVDELALLRAKYIAKIGNFSSYGYGGEDQEVVCSLNAGITVVLRLTADCPILEGSCYIHQIVGVGGWDEAILLRMKNRVNEKKDRRFGPVDVMDLLVEEIKRLERDEGVEIPKTPVLPRKRVE